MSEANTNKINSLKESLRVREKELLAVFKELDHYRRKCHKLKLQLLKTRSSQPTETSTPDSQPPPVLPQKRESAVMQSADSLQKKVKVENAIEEEGEIKEESKNKPQQKRPKKSAVTKFLDSISSQHVQPVSNKPPIEKQQEPEDFAFNTIQKLLGPGAPPSKPQVKTRAMQKPMAANIANPSKLSKKSVAYNQPYSMDASYTELTYNSLKQQPVQYTPTTVSLSQIAPLTAKFKEIFEITKKLYSMEIDFNMANISMLADALKILDPHTAATYLVNEMVECAFLFSPEDALSFIFGIVKEIVREPTWDKEFLKSLRPFFVKNIQEIAFSGKSIRLPGLKYSVSTLQEVLSTCFMIICQQCGYFQLIVKLMAKLVACKNVNLIKASFKDWHDLLLTDSAVQIFYRLVVLEENHIQLLQELLNKSLGAEEKTQKQIYLGFKSIFRFISIESAYSAYKSLLWPILSTSKDSFSKSLVIKMIAVLYIEIAKDSNKKVHLQLRSQLEEILTDDDNSSNPYIVFSLYEQQVASKALEKIGFQSKTLEKWKQTHNL